MVAYDTFIDSHTISLGWGGIYVSSAVSNSTFTQQTGEPADENYGYASAWWNYTPTHAGLVSFDTLLMSGEPYADEHDTKLSVWTGAAVDSLTLVGFNDDADSTYASRLELTLSAGTTYFIRVGSYSFDIDENYVLRVIAGVDIQPNPFTIDVPIYRLYDVPPANLDQPLTVAVPLYSFDVNLRNDDIDDAYVIPSGGASYTSERIPFYGYTVAAWEALLAGSRSVWWKFSPQMDGTITLDFSASEVVDLGGSSQTGLYVQILRYHLTMDGDPASYYEITGETLTGWMYFHAGTFAIWRGAGLGWWGGGTHGPVSVEAGYTYYIRLAISNIPNYDREGFYLLSMSYDAHTPPIEVSASIYNIVDVIRTDANPITVQVNLPAAPTGIMKHSVVEPGVNADLPVTRPVMVVSVELVQSSITVDTVQIEIGYDLDNVGGDPEAQVLSDEVAVQPGVPVQISMLTPSPGFSESQGFWRYRVVCDLYTSPWSDWRHLYFLTDFTYDVGTNWTVAVGTPIPVLWFVEPAKGVPGDVVTIYGHGMGETEGTVTIEGVAASVESWTLVADTGTGDDRRISVVDAVVDPEHYEIEIIVPDAAPPGGPLIVGT